ncbi:MAG: hypothetical protein H6722_21350 [Sandaracinus sp.]|nr:hypothetical protein [Sandaracinus sp.]
MQSPRAREDLELLRDVLAGYRGEALQQRVGGSTSLAERERLFALRVGRSVYEVAMQAWSEALKIRT